MTLRLIALCLMLWLVTAPAAFGQNGAQLSQSFVGKSVVVKLDMPASQQRIDVYPQRNPPFDYGAYAQRLKRFGTTLRTGDSVVITKVNRNSHTGRQEDVCRTLGPTLHWTM